VAKKRGAVSGRKPQKFPPGVENETMMIHVHPHIKEAFERSADDLRRTVSSIAAEVLGDFCGIHYLSGEVMSIERLLSKRKEK
jgi:hypothetical protein